MHQPCRCTCHMHMPHMPHMPRARRVCVPRACRAHATHTPRTSPSVSRLGVAQLVRGRRSCAHRQASA
eukprot:scaffold19711_cov42-Phaeocystis_antarctica.AAC.2